MSVVTNVPNVHIIIEGTLHKLCRVPAYIHDDVECCISCSLRDVCNGSNLCLTFTNVLTQFRKSKL